MAWCPVCKNEYREGITMCADCNVPLVDDLNALNNDEHNFKALFRTHHKELAEKFTAYLEYSDLHRFSVNEADDEDGIEYTVCIHHDDMDTAKKLYHGFAITESATDTSGCHADTDSSDSSDVSDTLDEADALGAADALGISDSTESAGNNDNISSGHGNTADNDEQQQNDLNNEQEEFEFGADELIDTDDLMHTLTAENINEASHGTYVRKSDKYNDYRSSAYTCILVGGIGIVFGILNIAGTISIISSVFSQIVMMTMFVLFLIGGIYMYIHSGKIKSEISSEEAIENKVKTWLTINVTPGYLNSIKDENLEDEVNYLNYCSTIRTDIVEDIPEAPLDMIDMLIDEHLSDIEE